MSEPGVKKPGRGLRIALIASLAVNLLVIGAVAGAVMRKGGSDGPRGQMQGQSSYGMPYIRALSKEDRRKIGADIRASGQDRKAQRAARRALYSEVLSALRADPFEAAALEAALDKQVSAAHSALQVSQGAWFDHVVQMSDADRTTYADRLEAGFKRRKGSKPRDR
jgi:uncharacterized membrane protein